MNRLKTRRFTYDVVDLSIAVEMRPCLWQKHTDDPMGRTEAWKEVAAILEPEYANMDTNEQQQIENVVALKWRNVRDAFKRSLKPGTTKKYIFHDQLLFLLDEFETNDFQLVEVKYDNTETDQQSENDRIQPQTKKKRKKSFNTVVETSQISSTEEKCAHVLDEDELYFASLLPTIRRMTEDEKLRFRVEVLQLIQKIKKDSLNEQIP